MAQDLLKTIGSLKAIAIGNCRKRIEEAARKATGITGSDSQDAERLRGKPPCGVTRIQKEKHGL